MTTYTLESLQQLSRPALQFIAKMRNIKANQKSDVIIQQLLELNNDTVTQDHAVQEITITETTNTINDIPAIDLFSGINLMGVSNNKKTTTNIIKTEVEKTEVDTPQTNKITIQNLPDKQTSYSLEDHIANIQIHLNNERVIDIDVKKECIKYINEIQSFFLSYDPTRIIRQNPDISDIHSIDINLEQLWVWEQTINNSYVKRVIKSQKRTPLLNRKKTDFVASIPGKVENVGFSNGKDEKILYFKPYQHLQKFNPDTQRYEQTVKPVLCPYVSLIKVNEQITVGSLGKLKSDFDKEPTTRRALSIDKVRSGYLNNWSNVFSWAIDYHDKFSDLFNENDLAPNKVRLQIAIEGADQLNLYKVTDYIKYQDRNDNKIRNTSEVSRSKLCTLATLQIIKFPQYIWKTDSYRYNAVCDYLNKQADPTDYKLNQQFKDVFKDLKLEVNEETKVLECKIEKRVLCYKVYLGEQIIVRSVLNPEFMEGRQVKQECVWLEQVRQQVQKLVINNNALIIADQLNDYDKLREHKIDTDKADKSAKRLLSTIKSLLNKHGYDTNLVNDYASLLLTYFIIDCKFSQLQIAALIAKNYKLIPDDQISLEDKVLGLDPNKLRKQALQELITQLLNKEVPDQSTLWTKQDVLYRHKPPVSNKRTNLKNTIVK